jgi:hypothetical protein
LVDANGVTASVPLSRYGPVRRPLEISILRRKDIEKNRFDRNYEVVLQSYSVLLGDFIRAVPQFDLTALRSIRFVFDRAYAGTVVLDDIGFSRMDPAFTRVSGAGGR